MKRYTLSLATLLLFSACGELDDSEKEAHAVSQQQAQYAKGQPVPHFDWSLERDLMIQLYGLRNREVSTHAVWRSDTGVVEGDCPSMGFGLPYDTSLTNPWQIERGYNHSSVAIGQAEPNGVYASTNTAATWIICVDETGALAPVYVESKVTVYPYPVAVDYTAGRVGRAGDPSVVISPPKQ